MTQKKDRILQVVSLSVSAILLVFITVKLANYFGEEEKDSNRIKKPINKSENDIIWGSSNAPLTLYMFSSYKCKFCSLFFKEVFPGIKKEYIEKGKLKFILKLVDLREDENMMKAVQATVCVHKFSNAEKLHELLITNPNVVYTNDFQVLLDDFILSNTDIAQCMLEHHNYQYVKKNNAEFGHHNFSGTPTFVISENVYSGFRTFEQLEEILKTETSETTM